MGDFNHGHIQWKSLESTGSEDQQFLFLIQDSFLTQPLGNTDHNQIHFDINVKSESKNKKPIGETS